MQKAQPVFFLQSGKDVTHADCGILRFRLSSHLFLLSLVVFVSAVTHLHSFLDPAAAGAQHALHHAVA
jgi:hypothetical protein